MTIPNVEPAVEQQQSQQQQQEYNYTKRDYKKRQSVTKHKRGGGNSYGRYRDEFSRYSSYKELPRYAVPSYVYYYPPSVYYPPSSAFDSSTTYNHVTTRDDEDLEIIMHEESMNNTSSVDRRRISDQGKTR
jgi:hypothetical protein